VIAGHLDSARSGTGALAALLSVKVGDPVEVSAGGMVLHYRVASRSTYRKTALPAALFRLVLSRPCGRARSGLKLGGGCPLTSLPP